VARLLIVRLSAKAGDFPSDGNSARAWSLDDQCGFADFPAFGPFTLAKNAP